MSENVVTIKGHQYKYVYIDGETKYMGPVGDAPALSEAEFLLLLMEKSADTARMVLEEYDRRGGSPGLNIINISKEFGLPRDYVEGIVDGAHAHSAIRWDKFRGAKK